LPRLFRAALAAVSLAALVSFPAPVGAGEDRPKIAIIVGPVASLTPVYLALAEAAASTAERRGATVARAYSPSATPANVLAAVADANIVIYFGHGYGYPNPYGGLDTAKQNGWALQGPGARGTHGDVGDEVAYYGEDWIVANARPAPGFVMIYSNTCYAPGASEGGQPEATALVAAQRVAYYSRSTFALGGSAYYATDFDRGAADLVDRILGNPDATYGSAFTADARYVPWGLSVQPHMLSAGQQLWLHRSKYTDGPPNYWYAFAGNPDLTPRRAWDQVAPTVTLEAPAPDAVDVRPESTFTLRASERLVGVDSTTVRLLDGWGTAVAAAVTYDAGRGVITLTPATRLSLSGRYRVAVDGVSDAAGNGVGPVEWSVRTRIDADALAEPMPVVLEPGVHELVRLAAPGSAETTELLEVGQQRWLTAAARARLDGRSGSWLQLAGADLEGRWVRESPQAHAARVSDEAALDPGTTVELRAEGYPVHELAEGAMRPVSALEFRGERAVEVDRLLVLDGRTYLRLAASEAVMAGRWVEVAAEAAPTEASVQRLVQAEQRDAPAAGSLGLGDWTLFRFDDRGRVVDRRTVSSGEGQGFATEVTLTVGARRFLVVSGGELAGWAVADHPRVAVVLPQLAAAPAE